MEAVATVTAPGSGTRVKLTVPSLLEADEVDDVSPKKIALTEL